MGWLEDYYQKWATTIFDQDLGRYAVAELIGCSEWKARQLIDYIREHPPRSNGPTRTNPNRTLPGSSFHDIEATSVRQDADDRPIPASRPRPVSGLDEPDGDLDEIDARQWVHSNRYFYTKETDTYVTFLSRSQQPLVVPGDVHRAMKRAYSNWDGDPQSINQICREFSIPRPWFIEYKSIHGWTHDSEPFSDEEMLARDETDLVSDALQQRRRAVTKKYERARWREVEANAGRWLQFEVEVLARLEDMIDRTPAARNRTIPRLDIKAATRPFVLVASASDFHWGMYSWGEETGDKYDRKIAEERLFSTTTEQIARLPGRPDYILVAVGSDWFHIDGDTHSTTKGTPQDTDGSPAEILITGCELARDHIDLLRQVAPVKVVLMAGNHDRTNAMALLLFLSAWYKDVDDVKVIRDFKPRVYHHYGENLICFHHGDTTPTEKLGTCMAAEARQLWGQTRWHIAFGGHLHHQHVREVGGITHYQLPSLAGTDRWHARSGYVDSVPGMTSYIVDKDLGVTSTMFTPVVRD